LIDRAMVSSAKKHVRPGPRLERTARRGVAGFKRKSDRTNQTRAEGLGPLFENIPPRSASTG
jgi:hypothetical protein